MKKFMDDPAVRAAADTLKAAIEAAAGREVKNLLVISLIPNQLGSGTAQACSFYIGCTCPDCAQAVLIAAGGLFGATIELEGGEAPLTDAATARGVH